MPNKTLATNTQQILAKYADAQINFKRNCLIDTKDLSQAQVNCLFDLAKFYQNNIHESQNLYPANQLEYSATLFYEASTRTKTSFNIALTNLGLKPINVDISTSSHTKGESLYDTLLTLKAMNVNLAIIRHSSSGVLNFILENYPDLNMKLINAGDGSHAHPTQALLDAFTLLELENSLKNKKIVIVGDILHSRVARSNIHLLNLEGNKNNIVDDEKTIRFVNIFEKNEDLRFSKNQILDITKHFNYNIQKFESLSLSTVHNFGNSSRVFNISPIEIKTFKIIIKK